jgi:hypothetical protein
MTNSHLYHSSFSAVVEYMQLGGVVLPSWTFNAFDVMSIFKIALDVEEGLFFDFGVGSILLRRPSWLEGMELHGWFLDGLFFGCIIVGRLLGHALTEGLSCMD